MFDLHIDLNKMVPWQGGKTAAHFFVIFTDGEHLIFRRERDDSWSPGPGWSLQQTAEQNWDRYQKWAADRLTDGPRSSN